MSTAAKTYTFSASTTAESAKVNTNFDDLISYINTNCIVKDGSLASTAVLSGPATDPTSANHYSRKQYVDDRVGMAAAQSTTALFTSTNTAFQTVDTVTITNPGKAVVVMCWVSAFAIGVAFSPAVKMRFGVSFDNGGTYTASATDETECWASNSGTDNMPLAANVRKAGTPTGDIKIRLQFQSTTTTGSTLNNAKIMYEMFKTVAV